MKKRLVDFSSMLIALVLLSGCVAQPRYSAVRSSGEITPVLAAVDMNNAKKYVQAGRVNEVESSLGNTALHYASTNDNYLSIARYLISSGALVDKKSKYGITPLMQASSSGATKVAELLINSGANIYETDNYKGEVIHYAIRTGNIDTIKLLLSRGAKMSDKDGYGNDLVASIDSNIKIHEQLAEKYKSNQQFYNIYMEKISKLKQTRSFVLQYREDPNMQFSVAQSSDINQNTQTAQQKETLEKKVAELESKKDKKELIEFVYKNPIAVQYIKDETLKLKLTGPKNLKVVDVSDMIKKGKSEKIIISFIKRVKTPYKEFSMDEVEKLQKMGLSDSIISAMMDVTTELLKEQQRKKEQQNLLAEQQRIAKENNKTKVVYQKSSATPATQQRGVGDAIVDKAVDKGVDMLLRRLF
ncbi:ankyrin repeat domain-containing protein [Sulfurimonas sp.]|uniref:ankyrin repeat domain-containing protein n=1 Tax=Sulfurimonas sp. TaxID=2022749 RepID=UPI00356892AC